MATTVKHGLHIYTDVFLFTPLLSKKLCSLKKSQKNIFIFKKKHKNLTGLQLRPCQTNKPKLVNQMPGKK